MVSGPEYELDSKPWSFETLIWYFEPWFLDLIFDFSILDAYESRDFDHQNLNLWFFDLWCIDPWYLYISIHQSWKILNLDLIPRSLIYRSVIPVYLDISVIEILNLDLIPRSSIYRSLIPIYLDSSIIENLWFLQRRHGSRQSGGPADRSVGSGVATASFGRRGSGDERRHQRRRHRRGKPGKLV